MDSAIKKCTYCAAVVRKVNEMLGCIKNEMENEKIAHYFMYADIPNSPWILIHFTLYYLKKKGM